MKDEYTTQSNFMMKMAEEDVENKAFSRDICTRFPPEPNGYLHIGSLYAIDVSYSVAKRFGGVFNLRFDDTNPLKESMEYVDAIIEDMKWAGYDPGDRIFFGSDYLETLYSYAIELIKKGLAFVCDLTGEQIREYRGTLTSPGTNSPYRDRTVEENLRLFAEMRDGKYENGQKVLRAKIDMSSPNINMRDPVLYRILHAEHYRTGDKWCIYPMYDYAHPLQDAIEGITHSMCSIEFRDHRPLYEWVLNSLEIPEPPKQREFGKMNITGAITGKRYLKQLVEGHYVEGWDDPRLPTIKGLRRRGFTIESIHNFLHEIGLARDYSTVDISMLHHFLRDDLKEKAKAVMAVLHPLKVVITNYPDGETELVEIENNPQNEALGNRMVPFSKNIYVEREDFMEIPEKGFHRLYPGNEVRLKGAYFIKCEEVVKNEAGEIVELRCTYDPETRSGGGFSGRKVKGTLHWVDCGEENHFKAKVVLYDDLLEDFSRLDADDIDWNQLINPESKVVLKDCVIEKSIAGAKPEEKYQFIRHGYFCVDMKSEDGSPVFNRIVALKDSKKKKG